MKTAKRDGRGNVSRSWELIKIDQVKLLVRMTKVENSVEKFLIKIQSSVSFIVNYVM